VLRCRSEGTSSLGETLGASRVERLAQSLQARPNVRAKATAEADAGWPRKDNLPPWPGAARRWLPQRVAALSEGLGITQRR
jgi:hypothetical protein